jgi:threonine synthase
MQAIGWIDRLPRMMAAEIYGSLGAALREGGDVLPDMPLTHDTVAKSTSATRSTFQALHVLRASGGRATVVTNDAIMQWQQKLAEEEGLYVEPASAGTIAAVAQLKANGDITGTESVVILLTASGLKDPHATASMQGDVFTVDGSVEAVFAQLNAEHPRLSSRPRAPDSSGG